MQVSGFDQHQQPTDLAVALNGYGQNGLGLANVPDGQVSHGEFLSVDISGLVQDGAFGGMATVEDLMGRDES